MNKGFIIAVPQKYQHICYQNILKIRFQFQNNLPIEIWQIGQEISHQYMHLLSKIPNIFFKYINSYTANPNHWKGFQIKAFILKYTEIKEPILCDADILFHQNPAIIYEDENYLEYGTYFFRDLECWKFFNLHKNSNKFQSIDFFNHRKLFIKSLLPDMHRAFPDEWKYIYETKVPDQPVNEAYQESGVVYINKKIHQDIVDEIYKLNEDHSYTYQFVWGDKETFWIACLMANKPFYINDTSGYMSDDNKLSHNYKNHLFFTQK